jgi:hypothetical protein
MFLNSVAPTPQVNNVGQISPVEGNTEALNPVLQAQPLANLSPVRPYQSALSSVQQGVKQAISGITSFATQHPVMTGLGVAGMIAGGAVCPCMGAMGAGIAGIGLAQKMMR